MSFDIFEKTLKNKLECKPTSIFKDEKAYREQIKERMGILPNSFIELQMKFYNIKFHLESMIIAKIQSYNH